MNKPLFVSVFVTFPLLFTSYAIIPPWYSEGTVTSTSIIGSRINGSASSNATLHEYFVAI